MTDKIIRIDEEVWQWLQKQADPFTDSPNSVLRRIAGLPPKEKRGWSPNRKPREK